MERAKLTQSVPDPAKEPIYYNKALFDRLRAREERLKEERSAAMRALAERLYGYRGHK